MAMRRSGPSGRNARRTPPSWRGASRSSSGWSRAFATVGSLAEPFLESVGARDLQVEYPFGRRVHPLRRERVFVYQEGPDAVGPEVLPDGPDPLRGGRGEEDPAYCVVVQSRQLVLEGLHLLERAIRLQELQGPD